MIVTRLLGYATGILTVLLLVLSLCMALQASKVKTLKADLARTTEALTEASRALKQASASGEVSVKVVEKACEDKKAIEGKKKAVKKRVRDVYNVKASDNVVASELSDSMWMAYCDGAGVHCSTK